MYLKDDKFKLKDKKGQYILDKNGNKQVDIKNSINNYKNIVPRKLIENEIRIILEKQNKLNNRINNNFIKEYLEIFNSQRDFNKETDTSNIENKIEKMLGACTFEKTEKRAVKASYTFEYFKFLQKVNNIKIERNNKKRILTKEEKDKIKNLVMEKSNITYYALRQQLKLDNSEKFNMIIYNKNREEVEKESKFEEFEYYHKIMTVLSKAKQRVRVSEDELDEIAYALTIYKDDAEKIKYIKKHTKNLDDILIQEISKLKFTKVGNLSIKAMKKLIPELEKGITYDKAVQNVYKIESIYSKNRKITIKDFETKIFSPVVQRVFSQAIKVLNAITKKYNTVYGKPDAVIIEFAKEFGKSFKTKNSIQRINKEKESKKWNNIQDTQYACKLIYNLIKNNLEFSDNMHFTKKIWTVKGAVTAQVRKNLGIAKTRDNDVHHAVDAVIIAITTQKMINTITKYYKYSSVKSNNVNPKNKVEDINHIYLEEPWNNFKKELEIRTIYKTKEDIIKKLEEEQIYYKNYDEIRPIFVSRMPQRKTTGKAHLDTIKRLKINEGNLKTYIKTNIEDLKLDKNNEICGYPIENKNSDKLLYTALKEQLIKFSGNGKQAFKEDFYKPKSDGSRGPLVKKVKIESNLTLGVELIDKKAIAGNGDCIRIDVFYIKGDGYYFIPIYVSDTIKQNLPNKACVSTKKYVEWKEMKEEDFLFSLYKNDLIYIKSKRKITLTNRQDKTEKITENEIMAYYGKCIISTGAITIQTPDGKYMVQSLGIKKLKEFRKYNVDILGNYYEVKLPEKRIDFRKKKN